MELSVKEFSDLVGLMLEARDAGWQSAERSAALNARGSTGDVLKHRPLGEPVGKTHCDDPKCGVCCVPTPDVSSARFVIDTAEIGRVANEAKALTREACAARLEKVASECDASIAEAMRYGMKECQPGLKLRAEIMREAAKIIRGLEGS
jgi:hypothetical protein